MQKNAWKLSLTLAGVLVLSACGSSGGGSNDNGAGVVQTPDGDLINLSLSPQGTVGGQTNVGEMYGVNLPSSFYGVWKDNANSEFAVHHQGTPATNLPQEGRFTYKGDAVWLDSSSARNFRQGGETTLNVDFARKVIDGKIEFSVLRGDPLRRDITLQPTTIRGTTFAGQATVFGNSGGRYEGGLYGDRAAEAAGKVTFSNNTDLNVAFGATKQ